MTDLNAGVELVTAVPWIDQAAGPEALSGVATAQLVAAVHEVAVTVKARTAELQRRVGFVLWELRGRLDDRAYMAVVGDFCQLTGYAERTLRDWRSRTEAAYGLRPPPAQEIRGRGSAAGSAARSLPARSGRGSEVVPLRRDAAGHTPRHMPVEGSNGASALPPPPATERGAQHPSRSVEHPSAGAGPGRSLPVELRSWINSLRGRGSITLDQDERDALIAALARAASALDTSG